MIKSGFLWSLAGKFLNQGVGIIISIILARILMPEDYGLLALALIVIAVAQIYLDMGFGAALIQKKDASFKLYNSVFVFNICVGLLLTVIGVLFAPLLGQFYDNPDLTKVFRVLCLFFIIGSFGIVHEIQFRKRLEFKELAFANIIGTVIAGIVAIVMAYKGYGVWTLVVQGLLSKAIIVVCYWIMNSYRPKLEFNYKEFKSILDFGTKSLLERVTNTVFGRLDVLMFGKIFSIDIIGQFQQALKFNIQLTESSVGSLSTVLFAGFSKYQNDQEHLKDIYVRALLLTTFVGTAVSLTLFLVSQDLFLVLLTEKWSYAGTIFKLMIINLLTYSVSTICVNLVLGLGYAGLILKIGVIKRIIGLVPLVFGYFYGIEAFLYANIVYNFICFIMNIWAASSVFQFTMLQHINAVKKTFSIGIILALLVYFIDYLFPISNIYFRIVGIGSLFFFSYFLIIFKTSIQIRKEIYSLKTMLANKLSAK